MNLIEKLGIEKCRGIVEGAPMTATHFINSKYFDNWHKNSWCVLLNNQWIDCRRPKGNKIDLIQLKQAIEKYDSEHAEMIDYS